MYYLLPCHYCVPIQNSSCITFNMTALRPAPGWKKPIPYHNPEYIDYDEQVSILKDTTGLFRYEYQPNYSRTVLYDDDQWYNEDKKNYFVIPKSVPNTELVSWAQPFLAQTVSEDIASKLETFGSKVRLKKKPIGAASRLIASKTAPIPSIALGSNTKKNQRMKLGQDIMDIDEGTTFQNLVYVPQKKQDKNFNVFDTQSAATLLTDLNKQLNHNKGVKDAMEVDEGKVASTLAEHKEKYKELQAKLQALDSERHEMQTKQGHLRMREETLNMEANSIREGKTKSDIAIEKQLKKQQKLEAEIAKRDAEIEALVAKKSEMETEQEELLESGNKRQAEAIEKMKKEVESRQLSEEKKQEAYEQMLDDTKSEIEKERQSNADLAAEITRQKIEISNLYDEKSAMTTEQGIYSDQYLKNRNEIAELNKKAENTKRRYDELKKYSGELENTNNALSIRHQDATARLEQAQKEVLTTSGITQVQQELNQASIVALVANNEQDKLAWKQLYDTNQISAQQYMQRLSQLEVTFQNQLVMVGNRRPEHGAGDAVPFLERMEDSQVVIQGQEQSEISEALDEAMPEQQSLNQDALNRKEVSPDFGRTLPIFNEIEMRTANITQQVVSQSLQQVDQRHEQSKLYAERKMDESVNRLLAAETLKKEVVIQKTKQDNNITYSQAMKTDLVSKEGQQAAQDTSLVKSVIQEKAERVANDNVSLQISEMNRGEIGDESFADLPQPASGAFQEALIPIPNQPAVVSAFDPASIDQDADSINTAFQEESRIGTKFMKAENVIRPTKPLRIPVNEDYRVKIVDPTVKQGVVYREKNGKEEKEKAIPVGPVRPESYRDMLESGLKTQLANLRPPKKRKENMTNFQKMVAATHEDSLRDQIIAQRKAIREDSDWSDAEASKKNKEKAVSSSSGKVPITMLGARKPGSGGIFEALKQVKNSPFAIHKGDWNENRLTLRYHKNNRQVKRYKDVPLSQPLKRHMNQLLFTDRQVGGGTLAEGDYNILSMVAKDIGVPLKPITRRQNALKPVSAIKNNAIGSKRKRDDDATDELIDEFIRINGEMESGNNSPYLKMRAKDILDSLKELNIMPKQIEHVIRNM